MAGVELRAIAPDAAVKYFRAKGYRPSFDHRDMEREEHAYNFTVAKAMSNDLLADIRGALDDALANGGTLEQFKKDLTPKLQEKGWWGTIPMVDPVTGEEKMVRAGSSRRLQTIFDTNMRMAYAAGQWENIERTKDALPYLVYLHTKSNNPREEHKAMHGVVYPVGHPFWDTFFPPNGWGCKCRVRQIAFEDIARMGYRLGDPDWKPAMRAVVNKRTGEVQQVPRGVDPAFNYNVGQARMRSLTPPPLDRPLSVPYAGEPASVPMPKARPAPARVTLPDDASESELVQAFLREFDAGVGEPSIHTDVTGEEMIISDDLFKDRRTGAWKVEKFGREKYLPLLAAAIKSPDEVWHVWEERQGLPPVLRRRYISRFQNEKSQMIAVFDTGKDGWTGVTTFQSKDKSYVEKQRRGTLVYRRADDQ